MLSEVTILTNSLGLNISTLMNSIGLIQNEKSKEVNTVHIIGPLNPFNGFNKCFFFIILTDKNKFKQINIKGVLRVMTSGW